MRVLFTCVPGLGHFNPLVELAFALRDAGHQVAFATAPAFSDAVTRTGLEFVPAGLDWDERRLLETVSELGKVAPVYRGEWMMNNIFLDRSPRRMAQDLLAIVREWRADLIITGSFEYGGLLAAEKLGLPYATASYTVRWNRWVLKHAVGRSMAGLRKAFQLPDDPGLSAFGRYLDLCFAPPSWTFEAALMRPGLARLVGAKILQPDLPLRQRFWGLRGIVLQRVFGRALKAHPEYSAVSRTTHFIGSDASRPRPATPAPPWLREMPYPETVFVSLGTVLSGEYPNILDAILEALRDKPVNLIMTLGGKGDIARFGAQPANVRIVEFFSQDELSILLPHVDLCINHAGYSSIMEALVRGIPLVLLPLVSDAPMNTQMCLSSGVTPELPPEVWGISPKGLPIVRAEKLTPAIIAEAAMRALQDPRYREAAQRMRSELQQRPGCGEAVRLLEQVVAAHRAETTSGVLSPRSPERA